MPDREESDFSYEVNDKGQNVLVRSTESSQRVYLRFTNRTSRPVDIWWRDFHGVKRHYIRLDANGYYDINSFISHPWEFTDASTKERFLVNNNPVYRPPRNIGGMMYRTNWNITIGVRSLKETVLLTLAMHIHDSNAINALGLPRTLAKELQRLCNLFHAPKPPPIHQRD